MKYLILCPSDKRIMHISDSLGYEPNGNLILSSGIRVAVGIAEVAEVEVVPPEVETEKYCYVDSEFISNPEWIPILNAVQDGITKHITQHAQYLIIIGNFYLIVVVPYFLRILT